MALTKITPQMFDTSATAHDLNVDNGTFVVDGSASRVGIGTATPSTLLDVNGTATATTFVGALTGNVTGNVSGTAATVTGAAQTNITSVGTLTSLSVGAITSTGNLGIGGGASDGNLHIRKTGISTGITNVLMNANFADGSNGSGLSIGYRTDETTAVLAPRTATGNIAFYAYNNSAWFEAMRMSTAGNIGIGTTNPAFILDVNHASDNGLARFTSGDANAYITIGDSNSSSAYNRIGVITHDMYFNTNNVERLRIDSSGNLLHGTTTVPTGVLLGNQLVSSSATGSEIIAFRADTSVSVGDKTGAFLLGNSDTDGAEDHFIGMWGKVSSTNGSQNLHFAAGRSGWEGDTPDMTILSGGNVGIGTASPLVRFTAAGSAEGNPATSGTTQANASGRFFYGGACLDIGHYTSGTAWILNSSPSNLATNRAISFQPNGGNVGVGTGNPSELFHVQHGTSNAKILIETDSSTSISEIQFKSANNEIHRIGVETATGNQGYGGSQAYSLNMFARSGREIHFGSGTTQHMRIKDNGHVSIGGIDPYAKFGVYRNQTDPYTVGSFLDYPTMELKHPATTGGYNGVRYTNTSGNYEWFAGTNQNASNAADFVFQGYDRGGGTYREMARIHDSGSITAPNQVGFRALGTRSAWIQGATTVWNVLTSANTGNASAGVFPIGLSVGADSHQNQYNIGSCFNVSNGRFTAPIEGKYQVYGSAYCGKNATNATSYMHFLVYVNNQQINEIYTIGGNNHDFAHDFSLNFSTVLFLEVNDYVDWRIYTYDANVQVYGNHCSIGAHLLS